MLKIGVMLGDDIGLEVVPETVKVMQAAAARVGLDIEWRELPLGVLGHKLHGHTMPQPTVQTLAQTDGFITGPIGHNAYPRNDPTWIMPPLRKQFDMFASVKPVRSYPNLPSLHKGRGHRVRARSDRGHARQRHGGRRDRRVPAER